MNITIEEINETTYYIMTTRGIRYTLNKSDDEWCLHSSRLALGRRNPGSWKFFNTLEELEGKLKAFKGISSLIN